MFEEQSRTGLNADNLEKPEDAQGHPDVDTTKEGRDLREMGRILSTPDFPVNLTEHSPIFPLQQILLIPLVFQGVSQKIVTCRTINQITGRRESELSGK